jgi:hypothetical protein
VVAAFECEIRQAIEEALDKPGRHALMAMCRGEVTRQTAAVWLKAVPDRPDSGLL